MVGLTGFWPQIARISQMAKNEEADFIGENGDFS